MVGSTARRLHPWLAGLFALGVLLQAYLAGAALPQLGGNGDFAAHASVGYDVMGILAVAILIVAGLGRADRAQIWGSIALFVDYVVQTLLPAMVGSSPAAAALHPANAIILFGIAAWLFVRGVRTPAV
jgi:sulfite exporter TauE/SafE